MQTYCDSLPCKNGGVCRLVTPSSSGLQQRQRGHRSRPLPSGRRYECECPPGFGGPTCERRVHPCQSYRPCSGNGICIVDKKAKDNREGYRCQCHLWWTGKIFLITSLVEGNKQIHRRCWSEPHLQLIISRGALVAVAGNYHSRQ